MKVLEPAFPKAQGEQNFPERAAAKFNPGYQNLLFLVGDPNSSGHHNAPCKIDFQILTCQFCLSTANDSRMQLHTFRKLLWASPWYFYTGRVQINRHSVLVWHCSQPMKVTFWEEVLRASSMSAKNNWGLSFRSNNLLNHWESWKSLCKHAF